MKTINVDGVDRDINELIEKRIKIQIVNGWMIIIWSKGWDDDKDSFKYVDSSGYTGDATYNFDYETYKEPKPKVKLAPALLKPKVGGCYWNVSPKLFKSMDEVHSHYDSDCWFFIWPYCPDVDGFVEVSDE